MRLLVRRSMNDKRLLLSSLLLVGCVSERSDDQNGEPPPRCTDSNTSVTLMVEEVPTTSGSTTTPWTLDSLIGGTSAIAHRQLPDGSMGVAIVDGPGASTLATIPNAGRYRFQAAAIPGTTCATFMSDVTGLYYGCAGGTAEAAGLAHLNADRPLVPFAYKDGALSVFTQSYASFTEAYRDAAGKWSEHEQYESSISFPTDVIDIGGLPVVCFINSGDHAVIKYGQTELVSAAEANSCKLAYDGSTLHVLTDVGHAQLPLGGVAGGPFEVTANPALANVRVKELFVNNGTAYALGLEDNVVKAVPLAGGEPIVIDTIAHRDVRVDWDDVTKAINVVAYELDTTGEGTLHPQTIEFLTHCLP
jgi:hypothetical protein